MRKIIRFTLREYKAAVRTKGFIIGLLVAPIMMSGSVIAIILLKDRVDLTDKQVAVIDHTGQLANTIIELAAIRNTNEIFDTLSGKKVKPAYLFEIVTPDTANVNAQRLALSDRVRHGELHAFMEIGHAVVHPGEDKEAARITYFARSAAMDDLRQWIAFPINQHLRKLRLADAGIEEAEVKDLFYWVDVEGMNLVTFNETTGIVEDARKASPFESLIVPIIFMMLLFMMVMMSVPGMLHSVMEEKTQRIAEVVLGSIRPFDFMMSKLLGGIAVSLTIALVYVVGGLLVINYMGVEEYVPVRILPWFFIYMLLAILMYGSMSTALGSTCSEPKDAQSLNFPAILPALIPMFIYFPVAKEPLSDFATLMSLIPPFTPMLMVLRLATPESIPTWQPIVGLIGVLIFTFLFVWLGGRIFRVAILTQGTPPKFSNIIRWAIKG